MSGFAVAATIIAGCSSASPTGRAISLFGVGVRHETLVDQSRSTPANGSFPGHPSRVLETTVFYPAEEKAGTDPRTGATPDRASAPYPLIVFAHGFGGSVDDYQALLVRWAEAGYVVAAPLFPLTRNSAAGGPDLADFANQPADLSFMITQVLQESARWATLSTGWWTPIASARPAILWVA